MIVERSPGMATLRGHDPLMHIDDLIQVEHRLGYAYELDGQAQHYQRICPRCRRVLLALAQAASGTTNQG
jgi:hypothetical protein